MVQPALNQTITLYILLHITDDDDDDDDDDAATGVYVVKLMFDIHDLVKISPLAFGEKQN